jgi:predicted cobalt transporter CbtA
MDGLRTRTLLLCAVLAGLVAGLVFGVFHFLVAEPLIEQAIAIEAGRRTAEAEVVTRDMQRVGLLVGSLLYGAALGLLFGVACALVRPRFPGVGRSASGLLAALVAGWLVGVLPLLKYPANPPGVGDPSTIAYRQALFLLCWVLSIGGLVVASGIYQLARARGRRPALLGAGVVYALYVAVLLAALPASPDPVTLPGELVALFRVVSLAGQVVLWGVLGAVFGLLLARGGRTVGHAPASDPLLPSSRSAR